MDTIFRFFEIMRLTPAIRNMIRDNKIYQIDGVIASSSQADMKSMDNSLLELYRNRQITKETALKYSSNPEMLNGSSCNGLPFF